MLPLETWLTSPDETGDRVLVLRHDVDQHPRSARLASRIEQGLGIEATWYFRWRTAHPAVVGELVGRGTSVGLHYETLTRLCLQRGVTRAEAAESLIPEARLILKSEIAEFERRFGAIRSVCPHGDTRLPEVRNAVLLQGEDCRRYGVDFDGNDAMRSRDLGAWLTDRSTAEGGWGKGYDPDVLIAEGVTPILAVIHPNNWVSGPALWADRLLTLALPSWERIRAPIRTGADDPRLPECSP